MIRYFSLSLLKHPSFSLLTRIVLGGSAVVVVLLVGAALSYAFVFGPSNTNVREEFIVHPDESLDEIASELEARGLVKHQWAFEFAAVMTQKGALIRPGGYKLHGDMDAWTVVDTLSKKPYLAWVTIPQGLRKEQIAEILAETLAWTSEQQQEWLAAQTVSPEFTEGVYYADTYLIPSDQKPTDVAARLRAKFQDEIAEYAAEATRKNLEWNEVLTLASLVERESAKNDKALVAGILWNRINKDMLLQVDATLQYAIGSEENGWWPAPKSQDKYVESPFNTYQNLGLPPQPIANPSVDSIEAVLNPDKTTCLYYLHDSRGRIYCSPTYKGHVANVNRYLK